MLLPKASCSFTVASIVSSPDDYYEGFFFTEMCAGYFSIIK